MTDRLARSDAEAAAIALTKGGGRRVTFDYLKSRIKDVRFFYDGTLTIAVAEHVNGFKAVGTSACADPALYDKAYGDEKAKEAALVEFWSLEAFLLREEMTQERPIGISYGQPHDPGVLKALEE